MLQIWQVSFFKIEKSVTLNLNSFSFFFLLRTAIRLLRGLIRKIQWNGWRKGTAFSDSVYKINPKFDCFSEGEEEKIKSLFLPLPPLHLKTIETVNRTSGSVLFWDNICLEWTACGVTADVKITTARNQNIYSWLFFSLSSFLM